jgi:hypothetical protein
VTGPGRAESRPAKRGSFERFICSLAIGPDDPKLSIEKINEIIAKGGAGEL